MKWAYDPKEGVIPPAREYEGRDGVEKDWSKTEEFLLAKIQEFAAKVAAAQKGEPASQETKTVAETKPEETAKAAPAKAPAKASAKKTEDVPF